MVFYNKKLYKTFSWCNLSTGGVYNEFFCNCKEQASGNYQPHGGKQRTFCKKFWQGFFKGQETWVFKNHTFNTMHGSPVIEKRNT